MTTGPEVNETTCDELAIDRFAGLKLIFELNPQLDKECKTIQPNTEYCTMGCVCQEPEPHPAVGDIVCRYHSQPLSEVNENTCQKIADKYHVSLEKFFILNPDLDKDCKTIKPDTEYCTAGFLEPLRAWDGRCGPQHNNATCIGTDHGQCCNSETWRCGRSEDDCRPGTCYDGTCLGAKVYAIDGKCGPKHGGLKCGGKWGDCCSVDGICGTGPEFCGLGRCESGNCDSDGQVPHDEL
ncbi:hypothetical protein GQ53DRAFT_818731 [Thozetella sp. PMI_491]|nr:hypothetical protein GQ53DRAFT_818731 [Thozetella sp. PMI_491]